MLHYFPAADDAAAAFYKTFKLHLPSPLSGVRVRGLSPYELSQLWQIVIFFAMGGDASSLKFKSILPR